MTVLPAETLMKLDRIPLSHEIDPQTDKCYALNAREQVTAHGACQKTHPKALLVFVSHRWLQGNWCHECKRDWTYDEWKAAGTAPRCPHGHRVGWPDDEANNKARTLIAFARWIKWRRTEAGFKDLVLPGLFWDKYSNLTKDKDMKVFFWIDFACVDQWNDAEKKRIMSALPLYTSCCQSMAGLLCGLALR